MALKVSIYRVVEATIGASVWINLGFIERVFNFLVVVVLLGISRLSWLWSQLALDLPVFTIPMDTNPIL